MNHLSNIIFMIRKASNFLEKILHVVTILAKTLKIFIFTFFIFNSSFFRNIFQFDILLERGFLETPNLLNFFKYSKS